MLTSHWCRFLKHGLSLKPLIRYDLHGNVVPFKARESPTEVFAKLHSKYGKAPVLLGWHEIRQLLFDYLPSDTVTFDKQV